MCDILYAADLAPRNYREHPIQTWTLCRASLADKLHGPASADDAEENRMRPQRSVWLSIALLLLALGAAQAGPREDADKVRSLFEQAHNGAEWDRLVTLFTPNVHYFASEQEELVVGQKALREYFATIPRGLKLKMSDHVVLQLAPTVLSSSGYVVRTPADGAADVLKISMVLQNVDGYWLIAQLHASPLTSTPVAVAKGDLAQCTRLTFRQTADMCDSCTAPPWNGQVSRTAGAQWALAYVDGNNKPRTGRWRLVSATSSELMFVDDNIKLFTRFDLPARKGFQRRGEQGDWSPTTDILSTDCGSGR
jgi:hypothetical protein